MIICLLYLTANSVFADDADFVIDANGILTGYFGTDENVVIPAGVKNIGENAFNNHSEIKYVQIPDSVTSIGIDAFNGCSSLTNIIIPNSVTSIGSFAFSRCSNLTNITIPDSVTSIGDSAFSGCSSLSNITIPNSVTSIGNYAFDDCSSLTSITIPDSVASIGLATFSGCSSLTNITIPDSVTSIGNYAFQYCDNLTNITIPDSVTEIGSDAFRNCSSLTSIIIPYGVTSIQSGTFYSCVNLASVTIPDSVTSIQGGHNKGYWGWDDSWLTDPAFGYCSKLTQIKLPQNLQSIENYTFYGSNLTNITIPASVTSIGNEAIPSLTTVNAYHNTYAAEWASNNNLELHYLDEIQSGWNEWHGVWWNYSGTVLRIKGDLYGDYGTDYPWKEYHLHAETVIIDDGTKAIGPSYFYDFQVLANVTIPSSVTSISSDAFNHCLKLKYIDIPNSITAIGDSAFRDCISLAKITLPDSVNSIGSGAFSGCSKLTAITMPDNINSIGSFAFENCSKLSAITIPEGVTSLAEGTFAGCSSLNSISLPNTLISIEDGRYLQYNWVTGVFSGCSSLKNISIPDNVQYIGRYAFQGCTNLANISIPNGVTEIKDGTFLECNSLSNVIIPDSVTSIEDGYWRGESGAFSYCTSLTDIIIPNSISYIGKVSFFESGLTSITIPEGVSIIKGGNEYSPGDYGSGAFSSARLLYAKIPGSVTSIESYSFNNNPFNNIEITEGVKTILDYAFTGGGPIEKVIIPDSVRFIGPDAFDKPSNIYTRVGSYAEQWALENGHILYLINEDGTYTQVNTFAKDKKGVLTGYYGKDEEVIISENITAIGDHAFEDNSTIKNVVLPDSVTSIGEYAFSNCGNLESVQIPSSVTSIANNSFNNSYIAISTSTGSYAAQWAKNHKYRLYLPDAPFEIDDNGVLIGYYGKDKNVIIPEGTTAIGDSVFYGQTISKTTYGPDGISIISYYTPFVDSVTIPSSVTSIGYKAIDGQTIIYTYGNSFASQWSKDNGNTLKLLDGPFEIDDNGVLIGYYGEDENIVIPDGIKEIGSYVFNGNNTVKSIVIPNGVTSIGYDAFSNCSNLESVTIPASVTSINYDAFYNSYPAVYASNGSYAEEWANNNGYSLYPIEEFVFITPTPTTVFETSTPDPITTPTPAFFIETPQPTETPIEEPITISGPDKVAVKRSITLTALIGENLQINNSGVFWSTSNKKIATVEGGIVTGKKAGVVEIRACAAANPSVCASKTITVIPLGKKVIISDIDNGTKTIDLGTKGTSVEKITYQLSASVSPAEAEQGITWSSQDPSIATVDQNGLVTATGTGKVNITATADDGSHKSKSFKLSVVSSIQDGSIVLSGENLVIQKKKVTLSVSYLQAVQPVKAKLVWSSSDPSIAKVSNKGIVTGAYGGTAVIKACSAANQSYCGSFTMKVEGIASSVVINDNDNGSNLIDIGTAGTANEKLTYRLSANVLPANVKQEVTWSSSNSAVASVDENGVVTGHSAGSAAITVTSNDDAHKKTKVTIKVTSNVQPGSLTLSGPDTFGIKESKTLTAVFDQLNQPVKNKIKWSTSDPRIAKVSNGTVTGVSEGSAVITACSASNSDVCASQYVIVGTVSLPEEPVFLMMAAAPEENDEGEFRLMSYASGSETFPEAGSAEDTPEVPAETQEPTPEPTEQEETPAAETAVPENNNSLQFAQEEINLQVGESLALDIVNPEAASFMVLVKGDENALSFDEKENTVTGLAEGDTVAYLADVNTVDIVDTMPIHVLSAQPLMMMAAVIPAENGSAELTEEPTAKPTEEPTAKPTETAAAETAVPENNSSLQFAQEEIDLQVGESLALDIVNPEAASFMVLVKGDENALSFNETENTVTGLAEGDTVAYLADTNTVDIVDSMPIHVLSAQPRMMMAAVIPAENGDVELTEEPTAELSEEPTSEMTEEPSTEPTEESIAEPTEEPTAELTDEPSAEPTEEPVVEPADGPAADLTDEPTVEPTEEPTVEQTDEPSAESTEEPTAEPTEEPAAEPTEESDAEPTAEPTEETTAEPTDEPTAEPTEEHITEPTDEPTAEPTEGSTSEPTDEPTAEPTEEPAVEPTAEPTAEPTPVPLIDPYFDSDEYELRVGETMQVWYHNPDNQTVYVVLSEGSEKVEWDETSFTITAAEPGDLTILLTSVEPYAVKARCVVHIHEAEKIPVDIFRDEEAKMVTNELIRLNDLLIEENAENYEVLIDDYENYKDHLYWNDEQDTLTAYKPGDVKLILRYPGSEEDLDSIIIHIQPAPEPETDPAPTDEPVPDPTTEPVPDVTEPDPAETDTTEPAPAETTEPDPAESEETPSDPVQTDGENPEVPGEGTDPEDTPADPGSE